MLLLLFALLLLSLPSGEGSGDGKIKRFIILMLENRSFDHTLGFLKKQNSDIDGCLPGQEGCTNKIDPNDEDSDSFTVSDNAGNVVINPHHSIKETTLQVYGYYDPVPEGTLSTMDGFIKSYEGANPDPSQIMQCFAPEHLPIMTTLAQEFGVFDGWFASVPGPTMVNRAYAFSATSNGMGTNDVETIFKGLPQKSMFRQALDMGLDIGVYFSDGPTAIQMKDMRSREALHKYHRLSKLYEDIAEGTLPDLSWIEPAYFNSDHDHKATDQHPDHDVSLGEKLIKDIYESLRASPLWEETVFIITYDEHGGFFDHVAPPENIPSPDGINSTDDPFDFTRLGVRIPTVIVSPWIPKGSVYHAANWTNEVDAAPGTGAFDHTSVMSTILHKMLAPKEGLEAPEYLTARDYWAATFEWAFDEISEPRTDCPSVLPEIWNGSSTKVILDGSQKLTDLQREIIITIAGAAHDYVTLEHEMTSALMEWTEVQGLEYCQKTMEKLIGEAKQL